MYYALQICDEYSEKFISDLESQVFEIKSYKKVDLDTVKKILKNFFDCYLDIRTRDISVPTFAEAVHLSNSNPSGLIEHYIKQKELYDDAINKINELTEGSDTLKIEIPSENLYFTVPETSKKLVNSSIYILPYTEEILIENKQGE